MSDEKLPVSVWQGDVQIGPVTLHLHVLDDGRRIIDAESFERFTDWLLEYSGDSPLREKEAIALAKLVRESGPPDMADFESPAPPEI